MGLLGAHMSIAGGLYKSIERGDSLKCHSIQIFTQSNRTWKISELDPKEAERFKNTWKSAKHVRRIIAHNSYLLNLTTADSTLRKKSINFFQKVLDRCEALGIESLITHPGSHLGAGEKAGIRWTAKSLNAVLKYASGYQTKILLENTAGQGDCIGHRFEQLAAILDQVKESHRVGFCFDTQHAFAAGYDLRTPNGYSQMMEEFDSLLSVKRIEAFHINDALKEFGCPVDRHQNIGKGFIGKKAFRPLLNDKRFKDTPMCLETNPGEEMVNYKKDLKSLRSLLN